jgi:hypothetical protein
MHYTYTLVRDRCRAGIDADGRTRLEIVYALNTQPPSGTRQRLVPALKAALLKKQLQLVALDIFDEYVRLHLPIEASAKEVEAALDEALASVEPARASHIPKEAAEQLREYLGGSGK